MTGSTNADLLLAAAGGVPEGTVLVAESQTSGRGRQGRTWVSPAGVALTFSVLLRPAGVPVARRVWLPLLTGVALVRSISAVSEVKVALKWPNDVLAGLEPGPGAGLGKLAGILAEQAGDAIVVGAGVNVGSRREQLPPVTGGALTPTSLLLAGARVRRDDLLVAMLGELESWYRRWAEAGGELAELREEYLRWCATVGREVRVHLPGAEVLTGKATGIDETGRLLVVPDQAGDGSAPVAVSAGDVIHVR